MIERRALTLTMLVLTPIVLLVTAGCSGGGGNDSGGTTQTASSTEEEHVSVVLRDAAGNPIAMGSTTPYSPRETCGPCHDVEHVQNGYHFQQGRTNLSGNVIAQSNFFGDGRTFIQSAGMYGKW